jgi:AraC family transcriptional regulator
MGVVERAVWMIESRLGQPLDLGEIAAICGVSRHHLCRVFALAAGRPAMAYRRDRCLGEAAKALAAGAPDILQVALDAGYGSHEAFTRAFRNTFGVTPEHVRTMGTTAPLTLTEPLEMTTHSPSGLREPEIRESRPLRIVGLAESYTAETTSGIPSQWSRFQPHIGTIPGQVGDTAYGVCIEGAGDGFDYLCGVEVAADAEVPEDLTCVELPARRYLVFTHIGHVSSLQSTVYTIWNAWLPKHAIQVAAAPDFELYDERFDPRTGEGVVEIWVPVEG